MGRLDVCCVFFSLFVCFKGLQMLCLSPDGHVHICGVPPLFLILAPLIVVVLRTLQCTMYVCMQYYVAAAKYVSGPTLFGDYTIMYPVQHDFILQLSSFFHRFNYELFLKKKNIPICFAFYSCFEINKKFVSSPCLFIKYKFLFRELRNKKVKLR